MIPCRTSKLFIFRDVRKVFRLDIQKRYSHVSLDTRTPTFQVFAANTGVGKTLASAGLVLSHLRNKKKNGYTSYIKPLQTGEEIDEEFVNRYVSQSNIGSKENLITKTLFKWKMPASPHLSAREENKFVSDKEVISTLLDTISQNSDTISSSSSSGNATEALENSFTLIETAGGVLSPGSNITPQADVYRPLRLPIILVGDSNLGGISCSVSALESLTMRGYDVVAVVFFENTDTTTQNSDAIKEMLENYRHVASSVSKPVLFKLPVLPPAEVTDLTTWYDNKENRGMFDALMDHLIGHHQRANAANKALESEGKDVVWWPFTQHKDFNSVTTIDSAYGDNFSVINKETRHDLFDGCASWWTQGVGHGDPGMSLSVSYAAGRYGHVIFPENVNELVVNLSKQLLKAVGGTWASRCFYTDNGSTATEVAIKMAFRRYIDNHDLKDAAPKLRVLAQAGCYHGDTLGVMNVAEPSIFNEGQHPWFECKALLLDLPNLGCSKGTYTITLPATMTQSSFFKYNSNTITFQSMEDIFSIERDQSQLAIAYTDFINEVLDTANSESAQKGLIGALMVEPILLGAGGMIFVDPLFQRSLIVACKKKGIPVIFDEVFAGFWRLGVSSTAQLLHAEPDISCYAKLLTGGVVPMSVTMASEKVFNSFLGDAKAEALLHGHSYTAHPIGCASALKAIDTFMNIKDERSSPKNKWNDTTIKELSHFSNVKHIFSLGSVCVVELQSETSGYGSTAARSIVTKLRSRNIFARPLGNVVYLMSSPLSLKEDCDDWLTTLKECLIEDQ